MYRDGPYLAGKIYIFHLYGTLPKLALPPGFMSQQDEC